MSLPSQRDLITAFKAETFLNVSILSKLYPFSSDTLRQLFSEQALDKPTQSFFIHLSYYLIGIIDSQKASKFSWPLYDTKSEKTYRTDFTNFVADYSKTDMISPVMSSYLVNPGCYKVTKLIFQLSQLAVQKALKSKMNTHTQKQLHLEMTDKFMKGSENFYKDVENESTKMLSKFIKYQQKRQTLERLAVNLKEAITKNEAKLQIIKKESYIEKLIDGFFAKHTVNENMKIEIEKIKNVKAQAPIFDILLEEVDAECSKLESNWETKAVPFLETAKTCQETTEALILRHTGEADSKSFMVEYNPKTDYISTQELEVQVNAEQKYILKNIIRDNRLNFPNLIRGYFITMSFVLKNTELGDQIYNFNQHLESEKRNYKELVSAFQALIDRVICAEANLKPLPNNSDESLSFKELSGITPLPDLTDLKQDRETLHLRTMFDAYTPLNLSKRQFNLRKKFISQSFIKPLPRTLMPTFNPVPQHDFHKSIASSHSRLNEKPNMSLLNLTATSQISNRGNRTLAEGSGFTKQQIQRLLSTKKSSTKKTQQQRIRRDENSIKIKKGALFNSTAESSGLFRSHSSPNLMEHREKKTFLNKRPRQLTVMQEDASLLEMSGIEAICHSECVTPEPNHNLESGKFTDTTSLPIINIVDTNSLEKKFDQIINDVESDNLTSQDSSFEINPISSVQSSIQNNSVDSIKEPLPTTPQTVMHPIRKSNSIEKIISRYKKIRASSIPVQTQPTIEETKTLNLDANKENSINNIKDSPAVSRILLPDLVSPSCSFPIKGAVIAELNDNFFSAIDDEDFKRRPRESLGTMLGVDQTFLDQFDLSE